MSKRRKRPLATDERGGDIPAGKVVQMALQRAANAMTYAARLEDEMKCWRLLATFAALQSKNGVLQMTMEEMAELDEAVEEKASIGAHLTLGDEDNPTVLVVRRKA